MNTIVLNTLTTAISEYDWAFQSITPTHAGDAAGLYALGGDDDAGEAINASIDSGITLCGASLKKRVPSAFLSIRGAGAGTFKVHSKSTTWSFPVTVQAKGESRAKPARGIYEPYLGFGYSNVAGAAFTLDRFEVEVDASTSRRTA